MRLSKYYLPITKDISKDVVLTSHKLMLKAGMIKQCSSGLYTLLPLGYKVMRKIENIIQEEIDKIGAMRINMPIIQDGNLWKESGRIDDYGDELLKIEDRANHKLVYSPTNEEAIVDVFRGQVNSYKQLPLSLYQINWKFRDEIRPRFGLMRAREFLMFDSYSFSKNIPEAEEIYSKHCEAYLKIFQRMGLKAIPMQADNGAIGGKFSCEFQILADTGESEVYYDEESYNKFCDICNKQDLKWSDIKGISSQPWAFTEEKYNEEYCNCKDKGYNIVKTRGIEVGHVFIFGDKYTKAMNVKLRDSKGNDFYPEMGSYGIGVTRVMAALIEAMHDENGIIWPKAVSPFDKILINLDPKDEETTKICDSMYNRYISEGVDILYDDTEKYAGEKFAIADLLGIPEQIIIGKRSVREGYFEIKNRAERRRINI